MNFHAENNYPVHFNPYLDLMPEEALQRPASEQLELLGNYFGADFYTAFESSKYPSPVLHHTDSGWLKSAKMVGINVRTIGDIWAIIPYCMTLPAAINAVHLLPILEPGVVSSLYGPTSWNINPEFFSKRLHTLFPHLDTVDKQLSLIVRLLHLMGKTVGVDVIPHVDRFAEQVLANPSFFEWIRRRDMEIVDHRADLYLEVRSKLYHFLKERGSLLSGYEFPEREEVFFEDFPETLRLQMMFGEKYDYWGRLDKRKAMVNLLYQDGYETLPATMGPPYRGIEVDPDPAACVTDPEGKIWRDYRIINPQKFSRVFGPLARFKLYEPLDGNRNWALDFENPFRPSWDYVCAHYKALQAEFDFDFMRGDMSHVQMRPDGTPSHPDAYYDLLAAVKTAVNREKPYFGYFAESFLAPPGEMAYGDECEHLEASRADSALGDLQSEPVGTERFVQEFARYDSILRTRSFAPNFTLFTADKDDPRFDAYYLNGNETRYFIGLFLTDMPAYVGLGFECRDAHPIPAPNEHYTKLYVFQEKYGPKSTAGPFVWGKNRELYERLVRQKELAEKIHDSIKGSKTSWLVGPDPSGHEKVLVWTQENDPVFVFAVNLAQDGVPQAASFDLPEGQWRSMFAIDPDAEGPAPIQGRQQLLLAPGDCRAWTKFHI